MGLLPASGPAAPPSPPPQHIHRQPDPVTNDDDARMPDLSPSDRRGTTSIRSRTQQTGTDSRAPPTPGPPSDSSRGEQAAEYGAAASRASEGLRRTPPGARQPHALPPTRPRRRAQPARPTTAPRSPVEVCCRRSTSNPCISAPSDGNADGNAS